MTGNEDAGARARRTPHGFRLREFPLMVAAGLGLHHAYRSHAENDDPYPSSAMLTDRSKSIRDRALDLATHHREDQEAVGELVRMARGKTRDLQAAARSLRVFGLYEEELTANGGYRLLEAAIAGTAVKPVPADQAAAMARLTCLTGGSEAELFAKLVELEPRLGEVADQARVGHFGRFPYMPPEREAPVEDVMSVSREAQEVGNQLRIRLAPLVGPDAERDDVVLRSHRAQLLATAYLQQCTRGTPP